MGPFRIKKIDVDLVPSEEALADRNKGIYIPVNSDASNAASCNEEETRQGCSSKQQEAFFK